MSPQTEAVTQKDCDKRASDGGRFRLWTAVMLAAGISLGILALFVLADALFMLPQSMLAASFLAWAGVSLAVFCFLIGRLRRGRRTLAATAGGWRWRFPSWKAT